MTSFPMPLSTLIYSDPVELAIVSFPQDRIYKFTILNIDDVGNFRPRMVMRSELEAPGIG